MNDGIILRNHSSCTVESSRLVRAAQAVLGFQSEFRNGSLTIVISDSETIRALNSKYAGIDVPTDVLSFPADKWPSECGGLETYLGDIVIARDYVSDQARIAGAALNDIMCLLAIHGTLHLMGYDHDTKAARDEMWAAQELALRAMDIDPGIIKQYGHSEHG